MANDFEHMFREIFGEQINRFTSFQSEQMGRVVSKVQDIAREAVKEEFTRMQTELAELRARVAVLEAERAQAASDGLDASF